MSLLGTLSHFRTKNSAGKGLTLPIHLNLRMLAAKLGRICPGVELVYYGRERRLEHDFIIAVGANPSAITMELRGAEKVSIDQRGDLILESKEDEVRLERPLIYQQVDGVRREVAGGYTLKGQQRVGFDRTWEPACSVIRWPALQLAHQRPASGLKPQAAPQTG